MKKIYHAAAVFIAPFISGLEWSKRFYGPWDKKNKKGGVIRRPDDMEEIMQGYIAINGEVETTSITNSKGTSIKTSIKGTKLTNAMKKGFKAAIESYDSYQLLKYKSSLIDIINLVHPKPADSQATVKVDGEDVYTIDAIIKGMNVQANTWEVNQSEAGQIVAQAVRDGKLDTTEAKSILTQAKADNWKELLDTNKLGILAALRNLRNILLNNPTQDVINKVCELASNPKLIKEGLIMPYQLDIANEIMFTEFDNSYARQISQALLKGYELSIPNLKSVLTGNTLVILDLSGSMQMHKIRCGENKISKNSSRDKAGLIAATIAKATNSDVIVFGSTAYKTPYNPNLDVFTLGRTLASRDLGATSLSSAWRLAAESKVRYDRVFILSDNEVNKGSTYTAYKQYVEQVGDPYVYSVDLASYGTTVIAGPKVKYYYGYGLSMFEDIVASEFNPNHYIDKIKQVVI